MTSKGSVRNDILSCISCIWIVYRWLILIRKPIHRENDILQYNTDNHSILPVSKTTTIITTITFMKRPEDNFHLPYQEGFLCYLELRKKNLIDLNGHLDITYVESVSGDPQRTCKLIIRIGWAQRHPQRVLFRFAFAVCLYLARQSMSHFPCNCCNG